MTTVSNSATRQPVDIHLAGKTYQQSMQGLNSIVTANVSNADVIVLQPGQLSVVQVQAGKQYKLRKSNVANQSADDLVSVRYGDALHVRYADGSVVHFEGFYSTCTNGSVCSVNLASASASGISLSADMANSGPVSDDGLLVYAHGNTDVLMSMAQDQPGLAGALQGAIMGDSVTYLAPSPYLGLSLFALAGAGILVAAPATIAAVAAPLPVILESEVALKKIGVAAKDNTATSGKLDAATYTAAGVTGVTDAVTLAAVNSALDSAAITDTQANTTAGVQKIVDAYKAILSSADGTLNTPAKSLTGDVYAAIGVTGVASGVPTAGSSLSLLDSAVDLSQPSAVSTEANLQKMADAAAHVMTAAGLPAGTTNPLTAADLTALGVTGLTAGNTQAVIAAIVAQTSDANVDSLAKLQAVVTAAENKAVVDTALSVIATAAKANTATSGKLDAATYTAAGVTGVSDAATLAAVNTALDSAAVTDAQANTTVGVQKIVDAYKAILASADSTPSTPATSLTGEVYSLIGVTGLQASGAPAAGSSLSLLDSVIDVKATADVNTEGKVQALADEANRVMAAAGQTSGTPTLSGADLTALGVTGLTANNTQAVINAIVAQTSDVAVDTLAKLQAVVTSAETKAATALSTIGTAAHNNTAASQSLAASVYSDAGVSGLTTSGVTNATLLGAVNSALDSQPVDTPQVSTTAAVQTIVNDYSAILASADGTAANTTTALTGNQYADVGVTGISGASAPAAGTSVFLLDSAVDAKLASAVDTVDELQGIATAAIDVIAAANHGTASVTGAELTALGVTGDFSVQATVDAINAVIHNSATIAVDTLSELQSIANAAAHPVLSSALSNVANLDVMSNLVFTSTSAVQLGTSGLIHITQTGGAGYGGEAAAGNSQDIDLATALGRGMVSIDSTGTKITINPAWDLDLGATYSISIDAGAFVSADATHRAINAVTGMTFSTVTPGTHVAGDTVSTDAHASQMMDSTGALAAGHNWLNIGGLGDSTSAATLLGSLETGSYALVLENYATAPADVVKQSNGIKAHDTNVSVTRFGADDFIYFDAQANNATTQKFDASLTNLIDGKDHGGVVGQTGMELGLVSSPTQSGSSAQILMGFVGNTANQIFPSVYTSTDGADLGFGTFLGSTPVLMG